MAENKVQLSKSDRMSVCMRHQYLQGSWNYERMQNGGWCFAMIPAIKKLYSNKEDQIAALKRHMEFYNTHPYVSAPVIGVTLALEEDRANGAPIDDTAIQGVKVGMMGPLAGVGDPSSGSPFARFLARWAPPLALSGNIVGPLLFFFVWNIIRVAFLWYTQEFRLQGRYLHHQGPLRWPHGQDHRGRFHSRHVHHRLAGAALGEHLLHPGCLHGSAVPPAPTSIGRTCPRVLRASIRP